MISTVEFNNQPIGGIVEICSAQESPIVVAKFYLDLGPWQPGLKQQPSEPRLHLRFRRFSEPGEVTESSGARPACCTVPVTPQLDDAHESTLHRHVDGD